VIEGARNRVLVGVPERLRKANMALRKQETLIGELRLLYGQRLLLNDSVVLDQMGELLGCPKIKGDQHEAE
jgi:hypothetical protein